MARTKTGIAELDAMLNGGLMQGDATMVAGSAGSGKTTLELQYLVNGITKFGENGIYVTFEELPDQIYRDANNFGWDLRTLENEGRLRVICTSPSLLLEMDGGKGILDGPIARVNAKRIVIDSLSHLELFVEEKHMRLEAYKLVMYLKRKGLTAMLSWESPQMVSQSFSVTDVGLSFLVDCIILLKFVEIESQMKKALAVLKMRGSDHDKRLREFEITSTGIRLAEAFNRYEGILTGSPRKVMDEQAVRAWGEAFGAKR